MCSCGACLTCAACEQFTSLQRMAGTLGNDVIGIADDIRDIATELGFRPYTVRLIWTRWSRGDYGRGVEELIRQIDILPTPTVQSVSSLDHTILSIGSEESGTLTVSQISGRFTEDMLNGALDDAFPEADMKGIQYFWEIEYVQTAKPPIKRRFTVKGVPEYDSQKAQWSVTLIRAYQNRSRVGDLPA